MIEEYRIDVGRVAGGVLSARWMQPAADSVLARMLQQGRSPWSAAVHLLWSCWLFLSPYLSSSSYDGRWLVLTLLSYPLFLVCYARTYLAPLRQVWRYGAVLLLLALLLLPWYAGGISYFIYGCILLVMARWRLGVYLVVVLLAHGWFFWEAGQLGYRPMGLIWLPLVCLPVGLVVYIEIMQSDQSAERGRSQATIRQLAVRAERERIGRDLHDLLGHSLSLISLKLELARRLSSGDPLRAEKEMHGAEDIARQALVEVRAAVGGMRAGSLAAELAAAEALLACSGVCLRCDPVPGDLPPAWEAPLAFVLRESATNIARHAAAGHAWIRWMAHADGWQLRIEDDGRGGIEYEGMGLQGLRERLAALGAQLAIASPRGGGSCLQITLPAAVFRGKEGELDESLTRRSS